MSDEPTISVKTAANVIAHFADKNEQLMQKVSELREIIKKLETNQNPDNCTHTTNEGDEYISGHCRMCRATMAVIDIHNQMDDDDAN